MKKVTKSTNGKTLQSSTNCNMRSKKVSNWEEYLDALSFEMFPANDEFFKRFAFELITWARENEKAFYIEQFLNMKNIWQNTFYDWVERHTVIKQANEIALQHLAIRNELYLREKDPSSLRYVMPQLSKRWLKEDNRRAEQKAKIAGEQKGNVTVIMEKFDDESGNQNTSKQVQTS